MKEFAPSSRKSRAALVCMVLAGAFAAPALGQDAGLRIVPGFEKVYGDLKKKESEQQKEFARADAEKSAAEALRLQGEKLVTDSDALIESHKVAYQTLTAQIGSAATSGDVRAEAKALDDLSRIWAKAEEDRNRGDKMIRTSQKDAVRAEDRRAKASRKLGEIRAAMTRTYDTSASAPAPASVGAAEPVAAAARGAKVPEAVAESALPPPPSQEATPAPSDALDKELLGGAPPPEAGAPLKKN
jgi:hypothetical protein